MKIMVVDDSKVARTVLKKVLKEVGYTDVVEAENGLEGLRKVQTESCDLVICDWHMPTMDGLAFVKHMKESPRRDVPILVVSSESSVARIVEVMQAGAQAYIRKPFSSHDLVCKIKEVRKKSELARNYTKSSMLYGSLSDIGFPELVQFLNSSAVNGTLEIQSKKATGTVELRRGEVRAAQVADQTGPEAFFAIACFRDGKFRFRATKDPIPNAMTKPTLPLLMEALRLRDERDMVSRA